MGIFMDQSGGIPAGGPRKMINKVSKYGPIYVQGGPKNHKSL